MHRSHELIEVEPNRKRLCCFVHTTDLTTVLVAEQASEVHALANSIADGARGAGADVRLLRVHELASRDAIVANQAWSEHHEQTRDIPFVDGNPHGTSRVPGRGDIPIPDATHQAAAFQAVRVTRIALGPEFRKERRLMTIMGTRRLCMIPAPTRRTSDKWERT